jgi:glycosyltransferase involved in cell wall biosynthesis
MLMDSLKDRGVKKTDGRKLAYLLNYFPVLSETFILAEIENLLKRGLCIDVFSLFGAEYSGKLPEVSGSVKEAIYLEKGMRVLEILNAHFFFLLRFPERYFQTLVFAVKNRNSKSPFRALAALLKTRSKKRSNIAKSDRQNILVHFILVLPFARRIATDNYGLIYAHFANATASFAMLTARLCHVPFCISIHATDLFVDPELLHEKLIEAKCVVTCTRYNKQYICDHYPKVDSDKVHVIYHGVDFRYLTPGAKRRRDKLTILAVGRLVPKKGLRVLVSACKILKERNIPFRCLIIGDGPERGSLELHSRLNHVNDRVQFVGSVAPRDVMKYYGEADVFVLPCVVDGNGDRDGIPNVIAEAMAMKLPVISTTVSGIPELVVDGKTGILVDPNETEALADAVMDLARHPKRATRMGTLGRKRVMEIFDREQKAGDLAQLFERLTQSG